LIRPEELDFSTYYKRLGPFSKLAISSYETNEAVVRAVKYVSESLKEADARQILEENAATLFGGVVK